MKLKIMHWYFSCRKRERRWKKLKICKLILKRTSLKIHFSTTYDVAKKYQQSKFGIKLENFNSISIGKTERGLRLTEYGSTLCCAVTMYGSWDWLAPLQYSDQIGTLKNLIDVPLRLFFWEKKFRCYGLIWWWYV